MIKRVLALVIVAVSLSLSAQTNVQPYNRANQVADGIIYSLPKAELNFWVTAECVIEEPGMFYQYAKRYFGTNDVIVESKNEWKLQDLVISSTAIEDTSRTYQVMPTTKGVSNNLHFYHHTNLISGVNLSAETASNINRRAICPVKHNEPSQNIEFNYNYLSEEVLVATSIPKMAEMAAMQIYSIRENRTALLAGNVDNMPDGDALKLIIEEYNRAESELLALFVGKRISFTQSRSYSFTPDADINNYILFRLSSISGLVDADDIMGTPVYLSIEGSYLTAPELDEKAKPKKYIGFYYNVPGSAVVTVSDKDSVKRTRVISLPQFGYTANLLSTSTDSDTAEIEYNPELGTIKRVQK